uniref:protein odr-4 homolog isoform X2 n=1 Tax=Myxine glutinosa TaxID=7769 RepID=UPI00358F0FC4
MVKSYLAEEELRQYLLRAAKEDGIQRQAGLFVGQCSPQKDYIFHAACTPNLNMSENDPGVGEASLGKWQKKETEWVVGHARQLTRMLPGGLCVIGVFLLCASEMEEDVQGALRKMLFAVEHAVNANSLWKRGDDDVQERVAMHLCTKSKKITVRSYDISDPKCNACPAEWKFQSLHASRGTELHCNLRVHLQIPCNRHCLSNINQDLKTGLRAWAHDVMAGVCLINGSYRSDDDLLTGAQVKPGRGKGKRSGAIDPLLVTLLLPPRREQVADGQKAVPWYDGALTLTGSLHCRAFVHCHKPCVGEALKALKRDIVSSLWTRCQLLMEDLLIDESGRRDVSLEQGLVMPRRVFVPTPRVEFCDYLFGDESLADVTSRVKELLDHPVSEEQLDVSTETLAVLADMEQEDKCTEPSCLPRSNFPPPKLSTYRRLVRNRGHLAALLTAILAMGLFLLFFME